MDEADRSDEHLLKRISAGDEEAFTALYRRRQGAVYRFALQMSGSEALAEDVTQEVFLTLMRDSSRYDPGRGSVAAFLYGIARHHVLRCLKRDRAHGPEAEAELVAGGGDPLSDLARNQAIESVRSAVLSLPVAYREVVVLCDLHEMDYAQAAATLGCAVGTVRSRLHRARRLLAARLLRAGADRAAGGIKPERCAI